MLFGAFFGVYAVSLTGEPLMALLAALAVGATVSYTHLDVYKRQEYSFLKRQGTTARENSFLPGAAPLITLSLIHI